MRQYGHNEQKMGESGAIRRQQAEPRLGVLSLSPRDELVRLVRHLSVVDIEKRETVDLKIRNPRRPGAHRGFRDFMVGT